MRWPWRRRQRGTARGGARHVATWAEPAWPPVSDIRLGFRDGSELSLSPSTPDGLALQAVAAILLQDSER